MKKTNAIGSVVGVVTGLHLLFGCAEASDTPPKLAKMIREASVVVICDVVVTNGTVREIVADTLLLRRGIDLPYAVGEEIVELRSEALPNRNYGEQNVIFLHGNPARPKEYITANRQKVAIRDGQRYYDMKLDEIKQLISAANQAAQATAPKVAEPGR